MSENAKQELKDLIATLDGCTVDTLINFLDFLLRLKAEDDAERKE